MHSHITYLMRSAFFVLLTVCLPRAAAAQQFSIQNGQFIDPDGKVFVPMGANVNPWNYYDWQQNIFEPEHQDIWTDCWNFNFMRAPVYMYDLNWTVVGTPKFSPGWVNNEEEGLAALKRVVSIYTAKKVVVMFDAHDFICRWPSPEEVQDVKNYFRVLAEAFKGDPYVWFNLYNEPGFELGQPIRPLYRDMHREVIEVIRDEVGSDNMILCTGSLCGQEDGTWQNNPIPEANSAFLTYGNEIINFNNKYYPNIAFDLHMYDQWAIDSSYLDVKLRDFLDRMRANNFAMLIGEVGSPPEFGSFNSDKWASHSRATELAYNIALKEYGIGMVQWHYDPEDDFTLIDGPHKFNRGIDINDCQNPTNLSYWGGKYFWSATHEDGFGLSSDLGVPAPRTVFNGTKTIPGTIEAEDYDAGGEGLTYHDYETSNNGGAYRLSESVDVEPCSEGGHNVGWTVGGEYLEYTVNVETAGEYVVDIRYASSDATGFIDLSFERAGVGTGDVALAPTGGWQTYATTTTSPMFLEAGPQVLRISILNGGFNLNYVEFRSAGSSPGTSSVSTAVADAAFRVYPNPVGADEQISLRVAPEYRSGTIEIINLDGQVIHRQPAASAEELLLTEEGLPTGAYVIRLVTPTMNLLRKLIIR